MTKAETWAEREQRLAEGRSSPSGWPIKRLDTISIPAKPNRKPFNIRNLIAAGSIIGD